MTGVCTDAQFVWNIPQHFNIARDCCDRWADGTERLALIHEDHTGSKDSFSFDQLKRLSNQLAATWSSEGIKRGDRIAICLPQSPATALAHIATYKIGAIAVPLFTLFGPDALHYRLFDCGAKAIVADRNGLEKINEVRSELPELTQLWCSDDCRSPWRSIWDSLSSPGIDFAIADTLAEDPALIIYTSGTTGKPKGVLHAHRVLLGHLPGVEMSHDGFPQPKDRMWTPADWAWIGGLLDVLLPSLHHGVTVVSRRFNKFDPEEALALIERRSVRNVFLPPTALKLMRAANKLQGRWQYQLRSIASGGESLGAELIDWGRKTFGLTINEFYGQTECNVVLSSSSKLFDPDPHAIGRAVPGHDVRIVNDEGIEIPRGSIGNIAVRAPDPVMFLRYWNNPSATEDKFRGEFLITGDLGLSDERGFVRFIGRSDDVITSAGYRIGPGPIEDCLLQHPAVQLAAVVGVPDPVRTEIVKAFVVLREGFEPGQALTESLQNLVKTRLGGHEYPRAVAYVDALPMTATGKIIRRELRGRT
jgi:acetyl-CoA synthetase